MKHTIFLVGFLVACGGSPDHPPVYDELVAGSSGTATGGESGDPGQAGQDSIPVGSPGGHQAGSAGMVAQSGGIGGVDNVAGSVNIAGSDGKDDSMGGAPASAGMTNAGAGGTGSVAGMGSNIGGFSGTAGMGGGPPVVNCDPTIRDGVWTIVYSTNPDYTLSCDQAFVASLPVSVILSGNSMIQAATNHPKHTNLGTKQPVYDSVTPITVPDGYGELISLVSSDLCELYVGYKSTSTETTIQHITIDSIATNDGSQVSGMVFADNSTKSIACAFIATK